MKTQVSILVKNEPLLSRASGSFFAAFNTFKKMPVFAVIDDPNAEPLVLKARKEPYDIELAPGSHVIQFIDPRAEKKAKTMQFWKKAYAGAFLAGASAAGGGSLIDGALFGAATTANKTTVRENYFECTLNQGDEVRISVQIKSNSKVKIKVLK